MQLTMLNSGSWSVLMPNLGGFSPFLRPPTPLFGLNLTPEITDIGEMSFLGDCMETCLVPEEAIKEKNTIS